MECPHRNRDWVAENIAGPQLELGGFTGPIPSELGQLGQLEVLDLSQNNLSGEVPVELGALLTSLSPS